MTKTRTKKISVDKIWSNLNYIYPIFEQMFDAEHGDGYSDQEKYMLIERAEKLAKRLIKIVKTVVSN